jgi:DNA-binding transcriptional LysR family regulator
MSVLLAAVEAGSLSAAGRKLGMPLPTVSRKVSELESHLKTRLLHRSTRRLTLTDSGRAYVEACKRILGDVEEAERAAAGEYSAPKGDLVISAPIVYGRLHVLPVVTEFLNAYPEVDVRLLLGDRTVNLFEDPVDLAVRVGELPDSSLIATRVGLCTRSSAQAPDTFQHAAGPRIPSNWQRTIA